MQGLSYMELWMLGLPEYLAMCNKEHASKPANRIYFTWLKIYLFFLVLYLESIVAMILFLRQNGLSL